MLCGCLGRVGRAAPPTSVQTAAKAGQEASGQELQLASSQSLCCRLLWLPAKMQSKWSSGLWPTLPQRFVLFPQRCSPGQWMPWTQRSRRTARIFLKASTMSHFHIQLKRPQSMMAFLNCLAVEIITFSKVESSVGSLNEREH
jgi:hypothetical protein